MNLRACFSSAVVLLVVFAAACGDDDSAPPLVCGPGTSAELGECVVDGGPQPMAGTGGGVAGSKPPAITCGTGTVEKDGECVAVDGGMTRPPRVKAPIGAGCELPSDCESNFCALGATSPGGLCTVLGCDMDNPCPVGSTCYQVAKGTNVCMPYCDTAAECRTEDGYNCQPLYTNGINICAPSCTLTNACPSGTNCNSTSGLCELAGCDPTAAQSACADTQTCFPDVRGLTAEGGLCLRLCDPKEPKKSCKVDEKDEVCQPLPDDPANTGFCAPPVCSKTEECPAGATCQDRVCQPPALCDGNGACSSDSTTCVGGRCMPKCPTGTGESCAGIHSGLVCASVLAVPACLPLGTFPGSGCRDSRDDACSDLTVGSSTVAMSCENDVCLVECGTGGTDLCAAVNASLVCATGVFDKALCLPKGEFPGGPCGANDSCAQNLQGNPALDMKCLGGTCVIDCDEQAEWPGYGDALCAVVDATLTCANEAGAFCTRACTAQGCGDGFSCFDAGTIPGHENACLPTGSFPGSPCRTSGTACSDLALAGGGSTGQQCVGGTCVIRCNSAGDAAADDALCAGFDPALTCSQSAGDLCVFACGNAGACPTGYSCIGAGSENACLPTGSFPGSPCRPDGNDAGSELDCDQNLGGVADADMVCSNDVCVVSCATAGSTAQDDALCAGVSSLLTCSESAGDLCVLACGPSPGFACPVGYSCLENGGENACLPVGSFPGSPCLPDDNDLDTAGECGPFDATEMKCVDDQCLIDCAVGGDTLCEAVGLTCSESAGNVCVYPCDENDGSCPDGFSCLVLGTAGVENACLPDGSFPGSACAANDSCDVFMDTLAMVCVNGEVCALDCSLQQASTELERDMFCADAPGPSQTCSESAGHVCVLACSEEDGSCSDGYSCLDPGDNANDGHENACLPDGSFPGSACAPNNTCGSIDPPTGADIAMACVNDVCGIRCVGGNDGARDAYCAGGISTSLGVTMTCSETAGDVCVPECDNGCPGGFSCLDEGGEDACLPNGTFPGSGCRDLGDPCDSLPAELGGASMQCTAARVCAIACDNSTATGNDAECTRIGAIIGTPLTCAESAGAVCVPPCVTGACATGSSCLDPSGENACLPNGTFPGSACAPSDTCFPVASGATSTTQTCVDDICVAECPGNVETLCTGIDPALTCSAAAGDLCVLECDNGGNCLPGYACLLPGSPTENECLPTGSFPLSPCRAANDPAGRCDADLNGVTAADLACIDPGTGEACLLPCAGNLDALCAQVDPRLVCLDGAVDLCVLKCTGANNDECPPDFTCINAGPDGPVCIPTP